MLDFRKAYGRKKNLWILKKREKYEVGNIYAEGFFVCWLTKCTYKCDLFEVENNMSSWL